MPYARRNCKASELGPSKLGEDLRPASSSARDNAKDTPRAFSSSYVWGCSMKWRLVPMAVLDQALGLVCTFVGAQLAQEFLVELASGAEGSSTL